MRRGTGKQYEISRIQIGVKPFKIDQKEIDILTKNDFSGNQAACVRKLIREALVHRRLVNEGKDVTMSIVKASQAEVIDSRLQPLITQIDKLTGQVQHLLESNEMLSKGVNNVTQNISSDVSNIYEQIKTISVGGGQSKQISEINQQLINLTTTLQPLAANSETALKNIIAMRSLFYMFLLGYQTGSIEEANKLSRAQWVYFVRDVQKKLNKLSFEEFNKLDAVEQHKFIEDYARQLFEQVRIIKQSDIKMVKN